MWFCGFLAYAARILSTTGGLNTRTVEPPPFSADKKL
jgi:hypothetical protein